MSPAERSVQVSLLDPETDRVVATMDKLQAHVEGRYHAAISVLLHSPDGGQLIQQRAVAKYHGGGLWSNACCSHPLPGESAATAAQRRLHEEMGITTHLTPVGVVRYRAQVPVAGGGFLIEHERVEVFAGVYDGPVDPDPAEVAQTRWLPPGHVPGGPDVRLTPWFRLYTEIIDARPGRLPRVPVDYGYFDLSC